MGACDEEPCKSFLDTYRDHEREGLEKERVVGFNCIVKHAVQDELLRIFMLWAAITAQALACRAYEMVPWLCEPLWVLSYALLAALLVWLSRFIWITERLKANQRECNNQKYRILLAWHDVKDNCPEECVPNRLDLDCDCR